MKAVLLTSSILIVLTAALRPVLRGRIDPRVQYALWLVAALRLLVPVNVVDSAYSALALLDRAEKPARVEEAIDRLALPAQSYDEAYFQAIREYDSTFNQYTNIDQYTADLTPEEHAMLSARARELQANGPTVGQLIADYARPVWLGGAALMGLWFLLVNLRLRRKLRYALPVEADCPLPVRVTPELPSPCLCGLFRPKIYVTPAALESPDRLRHVLTHELTHRRHRDHWWALVRCLCLCLYWFDPLVWWAAALSRQDCELACDEGAIRRLGEAERISYGRTLVAMIAAGRTPLLQTATTMTGGKRRVRERIRLIARRPKTVAAAALAAAVILGLAVGCTFTGAPEGSPEPDASPSLTSDPSLAPDTFPSPTPDAPRPTPDTLAERLGNIPEELRGKVANHGDLFNDTAVLADYWFDIPAEWTDIEPWEGYMLSVYQWDEARMESGVNTACRVFARTEDYYYAILWSEDGRFEGRDEYWDAFKAIQDFAEKTVLDTEGVEPYDPQTNFTSPQEVAAVINQLLQAPDLNLHLDIQVQDNTYTSYSYPYYATAPDADFYISCLRDMLTQFQWEEFDWGTVEDPKFPIASQENDEPCDKLSVSLPDYTVSIQVWSNSNLVRVHDDENGTNWYRAQYSYSDVLEPVTPYDTLRTWFDNVELSSLRAAFSVVDNNGQSHHDIAHKWALDYESAYLKCSPGNPYACTYSVVINVEVDLPDGLDGEDLEDFARAHGFSAEDFRKTWFGFRYDAVFVPVDDRAFWAGNTRHYEGDQDWIPEGALTYSRVGYMHLTDEGWTCEATGTGG